MIVSEYPVKLDEFQEGYRWGHFEEKSGSNGLVGLFKKNAHLGVLKYVNSISKRCIIP